MTLPSLMQSREKRLCTFRISDIVCAEGSSRTHLLTLHQSVRLRQGRYTPSIVKLLPKKQCQVRCLLTLSWLIQQL